MVDFRINRKLMPLITVKKPFKIVIGGRGGGKSIAFADALCMDMETKGVDVLCLREHQNSISDSVHRTLESSIKDRLKLEGWQIRETKIIAPNGAKTSYKGASRNPDALQSASGYKRSWFEEAHRASQNSLDKLIPTILRIKDSECWFSANPQSSNDPFSKRFINPYLKKIQNDGYYEDDLHLIIFLNWRDNPWWGPEQESLRKLSYRIESRAKYNWIWEGHFNDTVDDAIIKPEWFDASIDAHVKLGFKPRGAIVASHDPSDEGQDAKGFVLRHGSVILEAIEKISGDVNEGCDWALDLALNALADHFVWDCDGLGVSLKRQVNQALDGKRTLPHMFKGSESPSRPYDIYQGYDNVGTLEKSNRHVLSNRHVFKNKRSQHYIRLRDRFRNTYQAIEKSQYIDPEQMISLSSKITCLNQLRSEICRISLKLNGSGFLQILRKDEMKKLGIDSPNMSDSMMMSLIDTNSIYKQAIVAPVPISSPWTRR